MDSDARARSLVERALEHESNQVVSSALEIAGDIAMNEGDLATARSLAERGVATGIRAGDAHCVAVNVVNLVLAHAYAGRHDDARTSLATAPDAADLGPSDRAWMRYVEGERILDRDPVAALAALDESSAMCAPFVELIDHWRREGDRTHLLTTLRNVVFLLERLDLPHEAAELHGAVSGDDVASSFGDEKLRLDRTARWIEDAIGSEARDEALTRGAMRTIEEAAAAAVAVLGSRA